MPGKTPKQILKHILSEFSQIETALKKLKKKAGAEKARELEVKIKKVKGVKKIATALCGGTNRRAFS
jgi:hypothetical protein